MHARVAFHGGDESVREKGYLSFNPLAYAHPTLSILYPMLFLLMGGIGLPGGAVYIDRSRLRSPAWESAVSLAGPAANAVMAVGLAMPFLLGFVGPEEARAHWLWPALAFLVVLQVSAVLLNLIPVPPLDGYGAIRPALPENERRGLDAAGDVGFFAVFALLWFYEPANALLWKSVYGISAALGVPPQLAWEGFQAFRGR